MSQHHLIKLQKRYPNVSTEDFCEIFNKGLLTGLKAASRHSIPIEWIKETIKLADSVQANTYAEHLRILLEDWEEENEQNKGNPSQSI